MTNGSKFFVKSWFRFLELKRRSVEVSNLFVNVFGRVFAFKNNFVISGAKGCVI